MVRFFIRFSSNGASARLEGTCTDADNLEFLTKAMKFLDIEYMVDREVIDQLVTCSCLLSNVTHKFSIGWGAKPPHYYDFVIDGVTLLDLWSDLRTIRALMSSGNLYQLQKAYDRMEAHINHRS